MDSLVESNQDPAETQGLTLFPLPLDTHYATDLTPKETPTAAVYDLTPEKPSLIVSPIAEGIAEPPALATRDEIIAAHDGSDSWAEELMLDDSGTLVTPSVPSSKVEKEALDQQGDPEHAPRSEDECYSGQAKMKRKRREDARGGVPTKKKSRMTEPESAPPRRASLSKSSDHVESRSMRREKKCSLEGEDNVLHDAAGPSSATAKAKKKNRNDEGRRSLSRQRSSQSHPSTSNSKHVKVRHDKSTLASPIYGKSRLNKPTSRSQPVAHEPEPALDSETRALLTEIRGMLIECMATSRASCLPISSLYKSVMECRPSLKAQRSEEEWIMVFRKALRSGEAGKGSGVFGKVESSFKVCVYA